MCLEQTEDMIKTQNRLGVAQWLSVRWAGSTTTLESSGVGKDDDSDDGDEVPELLAPEDDGPVNETGLDPKDIELVMTQVKCSRATVVRVLKENEGDLINTSVFIFIGICDLTSNLLFSRLVMALSE
jgi:nascent polypeptide-associated complex subunit alpha